MRAESLRGVVSQTLLETQELMNAARSQCVAQQLQLHGTDDSTEAALKEKKLKEKEAGMAHQVQQMNRDLALILQGGHYSTYTGREMPSNSSVCVPVFSALCV